MSTDEQAAAWLAAAQAYAETAEERDSDWLRGLAAGLTIAARLMVARASAATRGTAAERPGLTPE